MNKSNPLQTRIRILEQAEMLTNESQNFNQYNENISDLYRLYNKIIMDMGSSSLFQYSLNSSRAVFENKISIEDSVEKLLKGKDDSFLVLPITTNNHLFSCLIRNTTEQDLNLYSAILINAGSRENQNKYEEYLFTNKEDLNHALRQTLNNTQNTVKDVYNIFNNLSDVHLESSLDSRDQVVGNCFIKELEKGIKLSTNPHEFIKYARIERDKKIEHLLPVKFTINNKDIPTEEIHLKYIAILKEEHPNLSNDLDDIKNRYVNNKMLRDFLKTGNIEPIKDNINDIVKQISEKTILYALSNRQTSLKNIDSYSIKYPVLEKLSFDLDVLNDFIKQLSKLSKKQDPEIYEQYKDELNTDSDLHKNYPVFWKQMRMENSVAIDHIACNLASKDPIQAVNLHHEAINLDENNVRANINVGLAILSKLDYENAIKHLNKAAQIKPEIDEIRDYISYAYADYSKYLLSNGDTSKALECINKAIDSTSSESMKLELLNLKQNFESKFENLSLAESVLCGQTEVKSLNVNQLKNIAENIEGKHLSESEIPFANKIYRALRHRDPKNSPTYENKIRKTGYKSNNSSMKTKTITTKNNSLDKGDL